MNATTSSATNLLLKVTSLAFLALLISCKSSGPTSSQAVTDTAGRNSSPQIGLSATPVDFAPPKNIRIERSWAMVADGFEIGRLNSVRTLDDTSRSPLIKDEINSIVGIAEDIEVAASETLWIGPTGLERYTGEFVQTGSNDVTNISAWLSGKALHFEFQESAAAPIFQQEFIEDVDYHWSTVYIGLRNRELEQGVRYDRKILDVVVAESKDVQEEYLGVRQFALGDQIIDCHVLWFDYGHVNGTIWIAEDEMGFFLVYEDAVATEGPFELILDEYARTAIDAQ